MTCRRKLTAGRRQSHRRECLRHVGQRRSCTGRPRNAYCDSPTAAPSPLDGWEYQLPPQDLSSTAARTLGAHRGHQHSLQRHDRAARKVWAARRGLVPGRGQCRTWRCQALPGAAAELFTDWRRQFDFHCRSSWCSSRTGMRWRPRPWTAAGRGCAMRNGARWRRMAMRGWRSPSTSAIAMTSIPPTSRTWASGWRVRRVTWCSAKRSRPRVRSRRRCGARLRASKSRWATSTASCVVIGARDPAGFELCGDTQASCHFVRAQLGEGGVVQLEDTAPRKGHARAVLLGRRAAVQSVRHARACRWGRSSWRSNELRN